MAVVRNAAMTAIMVAVTVVAASAVATRTVDTRAVEVIAVAAAEPAVVPAAGRAVTLISTLTNSLVGLFPFDLS